MDEIAEISTFKVQVKRKMRLLPITTLFDSPPVNRTVVLYLKYLLLERFIVIIIAE